jgi:hypothetical protein
VKKVKEKFDESQVAKEVLEARRRAERQKAEAYMMLNRNPR